MKRSEAVYLWCALGVAAVFCAMTLSQAARLLPGRSVEHVVHGAAGQSRDVDMDRLLPQLRRRELSDREAEFYKKLPVGTIPSGRVPKASAAPDVSVEAGEKAKGNEP
jgi:hypothetical protein